MSRVSPLPDFETRWLPLSRELMGRARRADLLLDHLSFRMWIEWQPALTRIVDEGGTVRILVAPDQERTCPDALDRISRLENVKVALLAIEDLAGLREVFCYSGKELKVVTSSLADLQPDLEGQENGPALIVLRNIETDSRAQVAIGRFATRWKSATPLDAAGLERFRAVARKPDFKEGGLVRSTKDLYRKYGIGAIQKLRGPQAKVEYRPSVFMKPPYRAENKILQLAELERVDTPLDRATRGAWDEPWRFELRMQAIRFLTGNKGGQLSNARTEILPHQIFAAHKVVSSPRRRFLLADEVGLGKTIEAGMIWQALHQRGQAKRALIITPAGLTTQWQEELQEKFGAFFEIYGRDFESANPRIWNYKARAIASLDTLKRSDHKQRLLENRKWDLIIFDEAHRLSAVDYGTGRVEKTQNYRLADEIRHNNYCDALLLLTATPHQGETNHCRFRMLLELLDEDINFDDLDGPGLFAGIGTSYTEYVIRTPKKDVTDAEGKKVFKGRQTHRLGCRMHPDEEQFYNAVAAYIRTGYQALERLEDPMRRRAAGFLLTTFQKLNASSTAAIKSALEARLRRLEGRLSECELSPDENDLPFEERDVRYEGEHEEHAVRLDDRLLLEDEHTTLQDLLAIPVSRDKKLDELLRLVEHVERESPRGAEEKTLIFTEYRQTQSYLVRELEARYGNGSAVVIHGHMKLERREEADQDPDLIWEPFSRYGALEAATTRRTSQRLFREHPRVRFLVSTEAGGEGINLQFCHICINYDLPWNPMRVEQRVGRIYRFGQKHVAQVYNFFNKGTIEETVQTYFEDRIQRAAQAVARITGEDPEEIRATLNGQLESEIDPTHIYQRAMVEGNLNPQTKAEIAKAVERAREAYQIATSSLFRDVSRYSFDAYRRDLATDLTLSDLEAFTADFLSRHHRQLRKRDQFVEFLMPEALDSEDLPDRYRQATFDRRMAIERSDAEFLALGHPFIDAMLGYVGSYDFGGLCAARRIKHPELAGRSGLLFLFVIRRRVAREDADECLFDFRPVFVTVERKIDEACCQAAVTLRMQETTDAKPTAEELRAAFQIAREHLERTADLWDWSEEAEFLGLSSVAFD